MLLDDSLPEFHVRASYATRITASPTRVYASLWTANFDHWGVTRALYAVRTLPSFPARPRETWHRVRDELVRQRFTLDGMLSEGFARFLGEMEYVTHSLRDSPDEEGMIRKAIVFQLQPISSTGTVTGCLAPFVGSIQTQMTMEGLGIKSTAAQATFQTVIAAVIVTLSEISNAGVN